MDLPELNEENCKPGDKLRPYSVTYDEPFVAAFLERTGESPADYEGPDGRVVPPAVFFSAYGRLIHGTYHYETGVFVTSNLRLFKAPPLGTKALVTGEVLRLFERNDNKYVTFSVVVSDESSGERFAEVEHTSIYKLKPRPAR
ncbi:MAG TPA: hypothetical protein VNN10_06150 [Dehalococcoidia bacterium]|nr:hypothetical protein [Dehalococcoidia bacterium]